MDSTRATQIAAALGTVALGMGAVCSIRGCCRRKKSRTLSEVGQPRFSQDPADACWLGGVITEFPSVDQPSCDPCGPTVPGDMSAFELPDMSQLRNKVLVCPNCSKPNAFTLNACNACGTHLADVEVTHTNNIFAGFIYGVEKGPFPYTMSLRAQNEKFLVFDDLLVMCPCHVNVVPTDLYIPDLRSLFKRPEQALQLLTEMKRQAWTVTRDQFIRNKEWKQKMIRDADNVSEEELEASLLAGFNFPPSQFQLHMQCMLPPFNPFHRSLFMRGTHFTYGRFFPFDYMEAALKLNAPLLQEEPTADDVIAFFDERGVCYDEYHAKLLELADSAHTKLSNWSPDDFSYTFNEDGTAKPLREGVDPAPDADKVKKADQDKLQNYGRPYNAQGKPAGTYYAFAKTEQIPNW